MANVFSPNILDSSGYPVSGTAVVLMNTLGFANTTAKAMFTIPAGAYILSWVLNVTTAFNSSGTDLIDIGISGTAQKFAAAVDVAATGLKTTNVVLAQINVVQATAQPILAIYNQSVSDANAGAMTIAVTFYIP